MVGQRDRAVRTGERLLAAVAGDEGIVAPAVQQQDALLAGVEILFDILQQDARKGACVACLQLLVHISDNYVRQGSRAVAIFQHVLMIMPRLSVIICFYARGSRRQQQQRLVVGAAELRELLGVEARLGLGFICVLLLLVDNYQTEVFERSEYRRARTYGYLGYTAADALVLVEALAE